MFGAIGFLGSTAVVMLTAKGSAKLGALAFVLTVGAMVGFAALQHTGGGI